MSRKVKSVFNDVILYVCLHVYLSVRVLSLGKIWQLARKSERERERERVKEREREKSLCELKNK